MRRTYLDCFAVSARIVVKPETVPKRLPFGTIMRKSHRFATGKSLG